MIEVGKLLEVVGESLLAAILITTLFSLAVLGLVGAEDRRHGGRGSLRYALLAATSLLGCIAAVAYGIVLLAHA